MTSRDSPDYSIIYIGQNTEKTFADLSRLAVTQTLMRKYQLTLVWKPLKGVNNNNNNNNNKNDNNNNKLWNMQVTIIPIVIGAFGTVTKLLLKGLEDLEVGGRVETIQTTALLRTSRILRRVLETWGDLLSLRLQWKTIG